MAIRQLVDSTNKYTNYFIPKGNSNLIYAGYFIEVSAGCPNSKSHTTGKIDDSKICQLKVSSP
jgi:hypothetical protein